ncbi:hypothetical protein GH714_020233 [Hevea brasiliensis]|uniref:Alpha/beta hydrolase fold-3 domain-containing protein n=1 Tax=Hevea brasiliensis TaxID=3981 RepID=A0A6A6L749_HEVBR|nr:hypothetical protein GH714_020233 [Hevea brasiliensis]
MSYNIPWKARIPLFIFSTAVSASCRPNFTVNRRLWSFFDFKVPASQTPQNGVKTSDIIIDASRDLWFRLYVPSSASNTTSSPTIIYMHGGGFCFFTADSIATEMCCQRLASELEAIIVSVNYRLAPEHRFPCQYEDCFDILKFIDENFGCLPPSADPNQSIFRGEERTESEIRLVGTPVLNVKLADWFWKAFLPDGSDRDHPAANVFGPKSDNISGVKFPAMLLVIGGFDTLQDWQRKYYQWMKKEGKQVYLVEYPNAIHGFCGFPDLPEYSLFFKEMKDFVKKQYRGII